MLLQAAKLVGAGRERRRNENRYDYYREGHVVNRASKVMGKWSKGGRKGRRYGKKEEGKKRERTQV